MTVFLQQLGRGLRLANDKECLTVLDFVGQANRNFRFDLRYRALLTDASVSIEQQVEHGFTHLPAGCTILMERVARQTILANIRESLRQSKSKLIDALREQAEVLGRPPRLSEFLERSRIEPDDLYGRGVSLSRLIADVDLRHAFDDPDEARLTQGLRRVAHINDVELIRRLLLLLDPGSMARSAGALDPMDDRRLLMLEIGLWTRGGASASAVESLGRLDANPTLRDELRALLAYQLDCIDSVAPPLALPFACPLTLHASYTRDEVLAALGHWTRIKRPEMREGVLHLPELRADVLFVTLHKTEKDYSPTTMYQDYAINERLFPLAIPEHDLGRLSYRKALHRARQTRTHRPAIRPRAQEMQRIGSALFLPRPCSVRQTQRQQADEHRLADGIPIARETIPQARPTRRGLKRRELSKRWAA